MQNRFAFPQAPAVNFNSPSTQIAGLGALGTGIFAASNIASGNDQISINPNVGFNFNPETGDPLVFINPKYFRPAEVEILLGDPTAIESELQWERKVTFDDLVKRMVDKDLELVQTFDS